MMNYKWIVYLSVLLGLMLGGCAVAGRDWRGGIGVQVLDESGHPFPSFPLQRSGFISKAYLEAVEGQAYSIEVTNDTSDRVGLVIAVDGRNIISGQYSRLAPDERLYILQPGQSSVFRGWRSGRDSVNRFYFTQAGDSYAAAFGDESAMGVIAVAAYRERDAVPHNYNKRDEASSKARKRSQQAGTGYGETEYSPARRVVFKPRRRPFARSLLKYEWREQLCKRGVMTCYRRDDRPEPAGNRLWQDNEGFAPPPPRRRHDYDNYKR